MENGEDSDPDSDNDEEPPGPAVRALVATFAVAY
eukprot:COSAG02_NODE_60884_length_270_cov_0.602339_1_plen_33_part_10